MRNIDELRQQLELVFACYMKLDDEGQQTAMDMTVLMLRQMLREQSGRRQRLIELGSGKRDNAAKRRVQTNAGKTRSKLVRKSNAASPQSPIKPVQTTRKNELRR
ncbi:hypothetical protein [Sulfitobacter sp. MF3-043]|uniref:hypothetical protein n=1 Tax=Sulfitobacter sediminivivens TaxID=3252902 RepID=UPI0036DB34B1